MQGSENVVVVFSRVLKWVSQESIDCGKNLVEVNVVVVVVVDVMDL
jgi:hypothetical protein